MFFIHLVSFYQGFVAFSSQGDRIALTKIEQVINGSYDVLGYYNTQADNLTWLDKEVWHSTFFYCFISFDNFFLTIILELLYDSIILKE